MNEMNRQNLAQIKPCHVTVPAITAWNYKCKNTASEPKTFSQQIRRLEPAFGQRLFSI